MKRWVWGISLLYPRPSLLSPHSPALGALCSIALTWPGLPELIWSPPKRSRRLRHGPVAVAAEVETGWGSAWRVYIDQGAGIWVKRPRTGSDRSSS